ncbi:MAG: hypothetical protein HFH73_09350 [Lachnospiraceae bacterium]|nr:hypothetical protein [Lachnospiraceae bacterium]
MKNLLLGNGINMHLGVTNMSVTDIAARFKKCLIISSPFYELLFGIAFTEKICNDIFQASEKLGIESLANSAHSYVIKNTPQKITLNFRMRLLDALICTALTAIFFNDSEKIGMNFNKNKLPNLNCYDNIFTLNYVEFWDTNNHCIFLHGKFNLDSIITNSYPVLLYSHERYCGFEGYDSVVKKLSTSYNTHFLDSWNIVFSPEFLEKSEMITLGRYPSENLYPAEDLFLHKQIKLYEELNPIKSIEIFGMSPYGDNSLIEKLNRMNHITVYVYDKDNNPETTEWNNLLKCPHIIKDSTEIMNI